jgi:transcriptional regulator with XRE-family HTH domain
MDFYDFITSEYVKWRGPAFGNEKSVTAFARYIGVSQPLLSQWMSREGKIPRSYVAIIKLADALGPGVFESLGIDPPVDYYDRVAEDLPPHLRKKYIDDQRNFTERWLLENADYQRE